VSPGTTVPAGRRPGPPGVDEPREQGQIGGLEAVIFGVLVFVIGTLVVANAWGVIDAKMAASAAAREATRAFVEASDPDTALDAARRAAAETIRAHGRQPSRMGFLPPDGVLRRCARVAMTVTYDVPLVSIPLLHRLGNGFTVSGRHSEIVDPFRSGLEDTDQCPEGVAP
jgi:hypothetical protein